MEVSDREPLLERAEAEALEGSPVLEGPPEHSLPAVQERPPQRYLPAVLQEPQEHCLPAGQEPPRLPPVLEGPPERCLPAALLQCLAVMALCTAVADPPWVCVQRGEETDVFGVIDALSMARNLTGAPALLSRIDIILLILMTTFCYLCMVTGLMGLFIDFLETKKCRVKGVKMAALLHVFSALFAAAVVGLCSYLLVLIPSEITGTTNTYFGLSFYLAIFTCFMSFLAAVLSFRSGMAYTRGVLIRNLRPAKEETAPLLQLPIEAQKTATLPQDQAMVQRTAPLLHDQVGGQKTGPFL